MINIELDKLALEECCNPETTVRNGDRHGNPFWNTHSIMFMYVPAFYFTAIPNCKRYRYDAIDENNIIYSFESDDCCSLLTPIWRKLPMDGLVKLTVTALNDDGSDYAIVGARTFYKHSPFTTDLPKANKTYKEAAVSAYKYAIEQPFVKHFLEYGTPDPYYDLNIYPTKMISSLVGAMISYARLFPEDKDKAMKIAVSAADYLMSITNRKGPLANLPPTYHTGFCPDPDKYGIKTPNWNNSSSRFGSMMMIYPAQAGSMYLELEKVTGDKKYFDEALKIGEYYLNSALDNGTWHLMRSEESGEILSKNYVSPMGQVVPFLMALYDRTNNNLFKLQCEKSVSYVFNTQYKNYNWEGQFEDAALSLNYSNLTHFDAVALARYYAKYYAHDEKRLQTAKELMRFVEDQFVIWKRPYPWAHRAPKGVPPYDTSLWHTPCGLEQYWWYVPIDGSTATIALGFLSLYEAGCGDLYLAKAKALIDQLVNVQRDDGQIPTHWMVKDDKAWNFWFNCMFGSCKTLELMSKYEN